MWCGLIFKVHISDKDDGCNLFNDTFTQGWLEDIMTSTDKSLTESDWSFALNKFLVLSAGALYDEMDKTFVLLSKQQIKVFNFPIHSMGQPRVIYGPAGSGKTLLVIAKIIDLIKDGEVGEGKKILYTCENKDVQLHVRKEVAKRYPDFHNLETKTFSDKCNGKLDVASIFGPIIH